LFDLGCGGFCLCSILVDEHDRSGSLLSEEQRCSSANA
jgi:hypothetical protein